MEFKENTLEDKNVVSDILQRLQTTYDFWMINKIEQYKQIPESEADKSRTTKIEAIVFTYYDCAFRIKEIIDDFSIHSLSIHKEG